MPVERVFVSKFKLRMMLSARWPEALQATIEWFAGNVSEAAAFVTNHMFSCNPAETAIDHLSRHCEGGGDYLDHRLGELRIRSMSILKTLNRMSAALKYVNDTRGTTRMLNGLPPNNQIDIAWPVMPTIKHLSSNSWDGLR